MTITHVARGAVEISQAFPTIKMDGGVHPAGAAAGALPSQAKTMFNRCSSSSGCLTDGSATSASSGGYGTQFFACHGCDSPHPWLEFCDGKHIVICANQDNPGVHKNAQRNIDRIKANCQKCFKQNTKWKNLGTANFSDVDKAGQQRIQEQVLQAMGHRKISNATSVALLVTTSSSVAFSANARRGRGGGGRGFQGGGPRIFVCNVTVLAAGTSLKCMMPISIQSNLPHIILQFGADLNCPNCPSICCAVDSCTALTTGNFHFFASIAKRFSYCVAKVFAPQNNAPIILSGVVQSCQEAVTTKLEAGFQLQLPYKTKEDDESSLMIATSPNVSLNTIIGLLFMLGMGMILNLVNNLAECKHLDYPPFLIDYQQTTNHVPVTDNQSAAIHHASVLRDLINEIEHLEHYYKAKLHAISSLSVNLQHPAGPFGSKSGACAFIDDSNSVASALCPICGMKHWWVPPSCSVLGENGYL
jgi:hypothetical protein